jgi:flavin reductase (DIM6/NTAB) family NADH-FMN oxidoreductase RutF
MVEEKWYRLLHPKVVGLVTSLNEKSQINCAPFAWLTPLCDTPPILLLAAWYESHTFQNISATKEFVINIASWQLQEEVEICARAYPAGVNELEEAGLTWSPAKTVKPPRVNECLAWIECCAKEIHKKENEYSYIIGEVRWVDARGNYDDEYFPKKEVLLHLGGRKFTKT